MAPGAGQSEEHEDPVLQLLVDVTLNGTVVTALQAAHEKFRRYHVDLWRLASSAGPDERARDEVFRTLDAYDELFHEHHQVEDTYLFPALHKVEPALDTVVDGLADEHRELAERLAALQEQARGIRAGSAPEDRVAMLLEPLAELRARVEEHLLLEEATVVPVVGAWTRWPV